MPGQSVHAVSHHITGMAIAVGALDTAIGPARAPDINEIFGEPAIDVTPKRFTTHSEKLRAQISLPQFTNSAGCQATADTSSSFNNLDGVSSINQAASRHQSRYARTHN